MVNMWKQGILVSVGLLSGVGLFQPSMIAQTSTKPQTFTCPQTHTIVKFKGKVYAEVPATPASTVYTCAPNKLLTCGSTKYALTKVPVGAKMPPPNIIYPTSTDPNVIVITGTPSTPVETAEITICSVVPPQ
jgi:hypothetical protein